MNYTWKHFVSDFQALSKVQTTTSGVKWPLDKWESYLQHYFEVQHGQEAAVFQGQYEKLLRKLEEHETLHEPSVRPYSEVPLSLLATIHYLISQKGIENPTDHQMEIVEKEFARQERARNDGNADSGHNPEGNA